MTHHDWRQPDLLVCGGGVAGTVAAVAAARAGLRVLLLERYGFLGGNATAGAVAQFNSWQTAGGRRVVAGLADAVVQGLRGYGAAGAHEVFTMSTGHVMDRVPYAPELLKLVLDDLTQQAGVQVLFHAVLQGVTCVNRQVRQVQALTRGGSLTLQPRWVLDASGDLELLRRAGAEFLDLEAGESLQPATLMFRFGPVDASVFGALSVSALAELSARGYASGHLARMALHSSRDPDSDDHWFNISRLAVDATDPLALSAAEREGRQQAWRAAQFLQAQVPGCGQGRLRAFATQIGVRETRRVRGDHVLTAAELLQPVRFDDAVAAGAYPIDIHPTQGGALDYRSLGPDHAYQIPWRSLIPAGLDNTLVAGRGLSATHAALAAVRVMTISMAVGEAAGTAAALLTRGNAATVRALDVPTLQAQLRAQGAILA